MDETSSAAATEPEYLGLGSRLSSGPSPRLAGAAFAAELEAAPYLHPELGYVDVAHAVVLAEAGVVDPAATGRLVAGLRSLHRLSADEIDWDPTVGDVYNNRDVLLRRIVGDDAGWLSTGRARREATTTAWILASRRRLQRLTDATVALARALTRVAARHRDTLMSDQTYLQHAHPTTLGHYLLGFAHPATRDARNLLEAHRAVDLCPAGAGSVNGSRFPLERRRYAELLDFRGVRRHTRDAMWAPDVALDLVHAAVRVCVTVDRLAEELLVWATREFGFVELDDAHCRTSVIMPQKKNPYALSHVRGEARRVLGDAAGITATQLSVTGQPDNRTVAYTLVPALLDRTAAAVELMAEVVDHARFDTGRLARSATEGHPHATDLCDLLVLECGLTNREAHRIVGRAVALVGDGPIEHATLVEAARGIGAPTAALDELDPVAVTATSDPRHLVALRRTHGGAAPAEIDAMVAELDAELDTLAQAAGSLGGRRLDDDFGPRIDSALAALDARLPDQGAS